MRVFAIPTYAQVLRYLTFAKFSKKEIFLLNLIIAYVSSGNNYSLVHHNSSSATGFSENNNFKQISDKFKNQG
jgi:hypothetical protein